MTANRWLRISIPIQGFLVLWQLATALLAYFNRIPDNVFLPIHLGGGVLLVALVAIHVWINRDWLAKAYRRGEEPGAGKTDTSSRRKAA